jgi:hypothetical protein
VRPMTANGYIPYNGSFQRVFTLQHLGGTYCTKFQDFHVFEALYDAGFFFWRQNTFLSK